MSLAEKVDCWVGQPVNDPTEEVDTGTYLGLLGFGNVRNNLNLCRDSLGNVVIEFRVTLLLSSASPSLRESGALT